MTTAGRGTPARGALVLVATPIGNLGDLAPRAVEALADADVIAAEDTRRVRALLSHCGIPAGDRLRSVHAHNEAAAADWVVGEVAAGRCVVYVSDAGMPGISDPGERLVAACAAADLPVTVVPGPSAALAAVAVSGLPSARVLFEGFLPRKGRERRERLDAIARSDATVVVFEAPTRLAATLGDLARVCGDGRTAAVARELTKLHEEVARGALAALAADFGARERVRGECVIVVGPAEAAATDAPDAEALDAALTAALAAGASTRDAAAEVAARFGVARRVAYERALVLVAGHD